MYNTVVMNRSSPRAIKTRSVMSLRPYLVINLRDVVTTAETFFISLSVPLILLEDDTGIQNDNLLSTIRSDHLVHVLSLHSSLAEKQEFVWTRSIPL